MIDRYGYVSVVPRTHVERFTKRTCVIHTGPYSAGPENVPTFWPVSPSVCEVDGIELLLQRHAVVGMDLRSIQDPFGDAGLLIVPVVN